MHNESNLLQLYVFSNKLSQNSMSPVCAKNAALEKARQDRIQARQNVHITEDLGYDIIEVFCLIE